MEQLKISEIAEAVSGKLVTGNPEITVNSISTDTRSLCHGNLFIALIGKNYDAHKFINDGILKVAKCMIVSKLDNINLNNSELPCIIHVANTQQSLGDLAKYYRNKINPKVIAITGSNGKTTTKEMVYSIFSKYADVLSSSGNLNNLIGLPLTLFQLTGKHKYCIVELGISFKGEMDKLAGISIPDTGIITNIGKTHLEFLNDEETVFNEKKKIVTLLSSGKTGIINNDDKYLQSLVKEKPGCNLLTFGVINLFSDVTAQNIKVTAAGTEFDVISGKYKINGHINLNIFGEYNVYNALAAITAGLSERIDFSIIKAGIETFNPPKMRNEVKQLSGNINIINDAYNSNPSSMAGSLSWFFNYATGSRKIVVLGDMMELGKYSSAEHSRLGDFINENGRNKIAKIYLLGEEIKQTGKRIKNIPCEYFTGQDELINRLKPELVPDTIFFFKASRGIGMDKVVDRLQ